MCRAISIGSPVVSTSFAASSQTSYCADLISDSMMSTAKSFRLRVARPAVRYQTDSARWRGVICPTPCPTSWRDVNVSASRQSSRVGTHQAARPRSRIDLGIVNILVGLAPLYPAEFIVIRIQQMAGHLQALRRQSWRSRIR